MADNSSATPGNPFKDEETYQLYLFIKHSQTTLIPFICGIGFAANIVSLIVFMQPSLRRLSCSVYLAVKSVSDFLFLTTAFVIWLTRIQIGLFNMEGVCQLVIFFSYLSAFVSIWLTVVLTVENLLCVLKPLYVQRSCNATSAIVLTASIILLGVVLYQFSLWNNGVQEPLSHIVNPQTTFNKGNSTITKYENESKLNLSSHEGLSKLVTVENDTLLSMSNTTDVVPGKVCSPLKQYETFIWAITYLDSLITIFVPMIILAVTNTAIVVIAMRSTRRTKMRHKDTTMYQLQGGCHKGKKQSTAAALETQASKFLFLVSVTMLVFHSPSHVIRLKMMVSYSGMEVILQIVFETVYYTHYAISFFVYLVFGSNFRRVFLSLVTRR
ncbi:uncharacterized protein LOC131944945 [Physella acuta]|uniref:uncharacterized protein LOC131944945 n=1 Tax=Physella acuta TaxID=109671 RepID=UPI0027DB458A|nr:uncharacterized protein LOC131944945 [Physella acuta]